MLPSERDEPGMQGTVAKVAYGALAGAARRTPPGTPTRFGRPEENCRHRFPRFGCDDCWTCSCSGSLTLAVMWFRLLQLLSD